MASEAFFHMRAEHPSLDGIFCQHVQRFCGRDLSHVRQPVNTHSFSQSFLGFSLLPEFERKSSQGDPSRLQPPCEGVLVGSWSLGCGLTGNPQPLCAESLFCVFPLNGKKRGKNRPLISWTCRDRLVHGEIITRRQLRGVCKVDEGSLQKVSVFAHRDNLPISVRFCGSREFLHSVACVDSA